jgi:hypothetical protein
MKNGKQQIEALKQFNMNCFALIDNQPPCSDLNDSDTWLRDVNTMYSRCAQMTGIAKAFQAQLMTATINKIDVDGDTWKKIKNSSTMIEKYVAGLYPGYWAICEETLSLYKALAHVCENTRTLMSSWRLERQIDSKTKVNQHG